MVVAVNTVESAGCAFPAAMAKRGSECLDEVLEEGNARSRGAVRQEQLRVGHHDHPGVGASSIGGDAHPCDCLVLRHVREYLQDTCLVRC